MKILVPPAEVGQSQTIDVGATNTLGLHSPISAQTDVIRWAKRATNEYEVQTTTLAVDAGSATADPGIIATGDRLEFTYFAP